MWPPPLLRQRSRPLQLLFAVLMPLAFGALCGVLLGSSELWFNVLMLAGAVGGTGGGFEHVGAREGALRGLVGGLLFASALLVTFEARGLPALASLPVAIPIMAVFYAIMGVPFGALGGWLRGRRAQ